MNSLSDQGKGKRGLKLLAVGPLELGCKTQAPIKIHPVAKGEPGGQEIKGTQNIVSGFCLIASSLL